VHIKRGKNLETGSLINYIWYTTARSFSNKISAGETEARQKVEVTLGEMETRQKVKITPESIG